MTQQASLAALHERIAAVNDVLNATSLLTWDSRTMMPAGGAETRGHQIATLTRLARDLLLASETEQALGEAEQAVEGLADDAAERRMVEQTRHAIEHHRRVPASLIQERAALRTVAQAAWIEARSKSDFSIFAPYLEKTVELSRAYADCIGWSEHPYDAMVSIYEPGETAREPQGAVLGHCGTGCCRSSMPRGPGLGLAPISCSGTFRRRGSAPSA